MARPYIGGTSGGVRAITASTTLQLADSGKTIFLDGSAANVLTLPAVSKGYELKVILTATGAAPTIVTDSSANIMVGTVLSATNDAAQAIQSDADADTITFVNAAAPGDYCDLVCDGTNWYVFAFSGVDSKITITKESA
tara:strand:+ start:1991 stop:2407 length:417 start_codon:yes stop_codon:yes gene_type:complete